MVKREFSTAKQKKISQHLSGCPFLYQNLFVTLFASIFCRGVYDALFWCSLGQICIEINANLASNLKKKIYRNSTFNGTIWFVLVDFWMYISTIITLILLNPVLLSYSIVQCSGLVLLFLSNLRVKTYKVWKNNTSF